MRAFFFWSGVLYWLAVLALVALAVAATAAKPVKKKCRPRIAHRCPSPARPDTIERLTEVA